MSVQLSGKKENRMKKNKNKMKDQEQKPRRLSLNRETILILNDPALLGLVKGEGTTLQTSVLNSDSTKPEVCP
jgi:hypothetical protein